VRGNLGAQHQRIRAECRSGGAEPARAGRGLRPAEGVYQRRLPERACPATRRREEGHSRPTGNAEHGRRSADTKSAETSSDAKSSEPSAEKTEAADGEKRDAEPATETKNKTAKNTKELKESDPDKEKEKDVKPDTDEQAKVDAEWRSQIDAQKAKIATLQREYDLTDREYKLFATTYYADAGNRLRDQKDFHDQETSYRDKLGNLKQQIADEQSRLGEIQDQAHKAGANKAYD
jgi:hypothetical protein